MDLAAVLLPLRPLLRQLVIIELALNPVDGMVEDVHCQPEQVLEVWFEAGVGQCHHDGIEDVGDAAGEDLCSGKRPGIGFVLEGRLAIELEFLEKLAG